jgi:hypothetical protein
MTDIVTSTAPPDIDQSVAPTDRLAAAIASRLTIAGLVPASRGEALRQQLAAGTVNQIHWMQYLGLMPIPREETP